MHTIEQIICCITLLYNGISWHFRRLESLNDKYFVTLKLTKEMKIIYRVLFFTRKTRPNKDGLVTIAVRITIDGESLEFNPKLYVNPDIWNPIGRAEGKTKEAKEVNQALDNVRTDLKNHYTTLYEKYGYVTSEKLRDAYLCGYSAEYLIVHV